MKTQTINYMMKDRFQELFGRWLEATTTKAEERELQQLAVELAGETDDETLLDDIEMVLALETHKNADFMQFLDTTCVGQDNGSNQQEEVVREPVRGRFAFRRVLGIGIGVAASLMVAFVGFKVLTSDQATATGDMTATVRKVVVKKPASEPMAAQTEAPVVESNKRTSHIEESRSASEQMQPVVEVEEASASEPLMALEDGEITDPEVAQRYLSGAMALLARCAGVVETEVNNSLGGAEIVMRGIDIAEQNVNNIAQGIVKSQEQTQNIRVERMRNIIIGGE